MFQTTDDCVLSEIRSNGRNGRKRLKKVLSCAGFDLSLPVTLKMKDLTPKMTMKRLTNTIIGLILTVTATAQLPVEKTPFVEGLDSCLWFVREIGFTENFVVKTDTVVQPPYHPDFKKRYYAFNPKEQAWVKLMTDVRYDNTEALYTVVYMWDKTKGWKKRMQPKRLPKLKSTVMYDTHKWRLHEDRWRNTYAISMYGNPYRPIRGTSPLPTYQKVEIVK